ncbi:MAG: hypothetical protein ABL904_20140 [Hyphomicrobiaceae bacterium]
MSSPARRFYARAKEKLAADKDLPDFMVYYLTVEAGEEVASTKAVEACYASCDLAVPSWLASHLSNGLKSKPKRFVKREGGYRLEHGRRQEIERLLGQGRPDVQTSAALSKLEAQIPAGPKREFLHETISCFNAGANRASVVMCWNLAAHHLQEHILADAGRHAAFDAVLTKNTDTRVKIKKLSKQDDFTEMSESKFLLFCREAKLITSAMYNKLETRLNERNAAAHPSGVKTTPKAAEAYIEDLVENVLEKFPV